MFISACLFFTFQTIFTFQSSTPASAGCDHSGFREIITSLPSTARSGPLRTRSPTASAPPHTPPVSCPDRRTRNGIPHRFRFPSCCASPSLTGLPHTHTRSCTPSRSPARSPPWSHGRSRRTHTSPGSLARPSRS